MTDQTAERKGKTTIASPTKPGWRPAKKLDYLKAPTGFTARWINADPDNVARKKEEGWIVMKVTDNKGGQLGQMDVNDGGSPANEIRYREMIAMMIPDEVKNERNEYYRSENRHAVSQIMKKTDDGIKNLGGHSYKPKGATGRIVIE